MERWAGRTANDSATERRSARHTTRGMAEIISPFIPPSPHSGMKASMVVSADATTGRTISAPPFTAAS